MSFSSEQFEELKDALELIQTYSDVLPVVDSMLGNILDKLNLIAEAGPPVLQLLIDVTDYGAAAAKKLADENLAHRSA
jgi:hypothetical protein